MIMERIRVEIVLISKCNITLSVLKKIPVPEKEEETLKSSKVYLGDRIWRCLLLNEPTAAPFKETETEIYKSKWPSRLSMVS